VVGVPTGLGKTACIDVAVWALSCSADRMPADRRPPTRTWYVVNRRLLVDAAYDHGRRLRGLLHAPASLLDDWPDAEQSHVAALRSVGDRLRSIAALGSDHGPLHVSRLRGGAAPDARVPDPSQPALLFSTVPMYASRWLFQGYGCSPSMRPIEAALAGTDSLVLLDESHLARPLRDLQGPAAEADLGDPTNVLPAARARPVLVELTATGDPGRQVLDLGPDDRAHPVVARRLDAAKPTTLVEATRKTMSRALADAAVSLLDADDPLALVVFCNTARLAREVHARLVGPSQRSSGFDLVLLTGRIRDRDGEAIRRRLLDPQTGAPAGRPEGVPDRHLVVVATQTLEVGADLDFDRLVTETAGTRAMVQRFGRLNRLGERNDRARAVVCHATDDKDRPVYGEEPAAVWSSLRAQGGGLDLGPGRITDVLGEPHDTPVRTAELLPAHLWEWAKTSCPPPGMAPIEPFVEGIAPDWATVTVAWRAHLPSPSEDEPAVTQQEQLQLFPRLRAAETVEVPLGELRQTLDDAGLARVRRLVDGAVLDDVAPARLRPGDQVVLSTQAGLYDDDGWNPQARAEVLDVSGLHSGTLVLERPVLNNLLGDVPEELTAAIRAVMTPDEDDVLAQVAPAGDILQALRPATPRPGITAAEWAAFIDGLGSRAEITPAGLPPHIPPAPKGRTGIGHVAADAFDELSFLATSVGLDDHLQVVGAAAERVLAALGGTDRLVRVLRDAGRYHDLGKADPRFQRWLDPDGLADRLLAKSSTPPARRTATRIAAGWPQGGRHELLSARLVSAWLTEHGPLSPDDELLLHLVLTHHGHGRPTLNAILDDSHGPTRAEVEGHPVEVPGDLSLHDWGQPARFRRLCERYGYWGLALLEAAVRQADHAASAQVDTAGRTVLEVA
jgi:CRISPR-associated endonuclease/helicase Cas3